MGYSESIKIFSKPWIWTAAILGSIQALAWTALAIVAICYYHGAIDYSELSVSSYGSYILMMFLEPNVKFNDPVTTPKTFNFFMYIYMILSFIWFILSAYLIWAMIRNKWDNLMNGVAGWAILTLLISALDISLMGMVASDLATFRSSTADIVFPTGATVLPETTEELTTEELTTVTDPEAAEDEGSVRILTNQLNLDIIDISDHTKTIISTTYGIVMTLAARGYILWLANVAIAVMMIVIAIKMNKEGRPSLLPFIDAYGTESRPPFDLSKGGNVNDSFQNDDSFEIPTWLNNNGNNNHRRSFNNPLANGNGYKPPTTPTKPTNYVLPPPSGENVMFSRPMESSSLERPQYEKVAKIGRGNNMGRGGNLPQNVPPPNVPQQYAQGGRGFPYIPDPDYTPPGSPTRQNQPRSVLRPKSNYVL